MRFRGTFVLLLSCFLTACHVELVVVPEHRNSTSVALETLPNVLPTTTETLLPGATLTSTEPIQLTATPQPIVQSIESGEGHSCALISDGTVKCWGKNEFGQLGDGTTENRDTPVKVLGLDNAQALAVGWGHTCVITSDGVVLCWGYNANGELGDGTTIHSSLPVYLKGLSGGAQSISAGDDHTCIVTVVGSVQCWGFNRSGQLGDGTTLNRNTAVNVVGVIGAEIVAAGWEHTCVVTMDASVSCWGSNEFGQLGKATQEENMPFRIVLEELGHEVGALTAGGGHTCALLFNGEVRCWGSNQYGQLGDGSTNDSTLPVSVASLEGVKALAAGDRHTCAIVGNGEMLCWGWNFYGQLGYENRSMQAEPVSVVGLPGIVIDMGLGWRHTCVVVESGKIACWGANEYGQAWNDLQPACPPETASNVPLQGRYIGLVYPGLMEGFEWMEYLSVGSFQDRPLIVTTGKTQEHYAILLEVLVCQDEQGDSYWEVLDEILIPTLKGNEFISLSCDTYSEYEGRHVVGIGANYKDHGWISSSTLGAWVVSLTGGVFEEIPLEDDEGFYDVDCQFDWSRRTKD